MQKSVKAASNSSLACKVQLAKNGHAAAAQAISRQCECGVRVTAATIAHSTQASIVALSAFSHDSWVLLILKECARWVPGAQCADAQERDRTRSFMSTSSVISKRERTRIVGKTSSGATLDMDELSAWVGI
tara:strand:+ start:958 stop:1350 length:393 start_codon:yes stop_codon:yes gene_type:complete